MTKETFLNDVFRYAERDAYFVRDVSFGSDVPAGVGGTHHITLRRSRKTSLRVKRATSLAR